MFCNSRTVCDKLSASASRRWRSLHTVCTVEMGFIHVFQFFIAHQQLDSLCCSRWQQRQIGRINDCYHVASRFVAISSKVIDRRVQVPRRVLIDANRITSHTPTHLSRKPSTVVTHTKQKLFINFIHSRIFNSLSWMRKAH